jgi:prevent-host-death family protein
MQTVSYTEASANLEALMDKAASESLPILITGADGGNVVMVSMEKWTEVALAAGWKSGFQYAWALLPRHPEQSENVTT